MCPYRLILAGPGWYLVAHCEHSKGVRVFRVDRIEEAQPLGEKYVAPPAATLATALDSGPVFASADAPITLRVRYSAMIAHWIAEREQGSAEEDGSYVVEYPLADVDWALRHALQYGAEAEILAPADVRHATSAVGVNAGRCRSVNPYNGTPAESALCRLCHRDRLHKRFLKPDIWAAHKAHVRRGGYASDVRRPEIVRELDAFRKAWRNGETLELSQLRPRIVPADAWWERFTTDPSSLTSAESRPRQ